MKTGVKFGISAMSQLMRASRISNYYNNMDPAKVTKFLIASETRDL